MECGLVHMMELQTLLLISIEVEHTCSNSAPEAQSWPKNDLLSHHNSCVLPQTRPELRNESAVVHVEQLVV